MEKLLEKMVTNFSALFVFDFPKPKDGPEDFIFSVGLHYFAGYAAKSGYKE